MARRTLAPEALYSSETFDLCRRVLFRETDEALRRASERLRKIDPGGRRALDLLRELEGRQAP
ncbi:MAG TPA: hypothetical protein VJJ47_01820 [Candidatus Paceibacterota bacterium]